MLSYATSMPNTRSAKKALRSSLRKRQFNNLWRDKIKESIRSLEDHIGNKKADVDILNKELTLLQKVLDKATRKNVIHRNKANRLKSRYAKRITALNKENKKKSTSKGQKGKNKKGKGTAAGKKSKS